MQDLEEWRDIEGYEGLYQVSSLGRVRSTPKQRRHTTIILSQHINPSGYYTVSLYKDKHLRTRPVHRLVALAFMPNPDGKKEVNHINGIKTDCRLENLEWVTKSENAVHACRLGLRDMNKVRASRKRPVVRCDGKRFDSIAEAAKQSNATTQNVWRVLNGMAKTARGYAFRYLEETA